MSEKSDNTNLDCSNPASESADPGPRPPFVPPNAPWPFPPPPPLNDLGQPDPDYAAHGKTRTGRPKRPATGRRGIIQMIDAILSEEGGRNKLKNAFLNQMDTDPLEFYKKVVEPLIPSSMLDDEKGGSDDKAQELRDALRQMEEASAASAAAAAQAKAAQERLASLTGVTPPGTPPPPPQ